MQLGMLLLDTSGAFESMPRLSTGMLALLATNHARYLTNKAILR